MGKLVLLLEVPKARRVVLEAFEPIWFDLCHFFIGCHCLLVFRLLKETTCNLALDPAGLFLLGGQLSVGQFSLSTLEGALESKGFTDQLEQINQSVPGLIGCLDPACWNGLHLELITRQALPICDFLFNYNSRLLTFPACLSVGCICKFCLSAKTTPNYNAFAEQTANAVLKMHERFILA